jgi:NAD(P)-dependent dehydrogenase (short-subunit alcohol dehydrogenase family)
MLASPQPTKRGRGPAGKQEFQPARIGQSDTNPTRRNGATVSQIPEQKQVPPGNEAAMEPDADHGERSYVGHDRLAGKKALITGADSGIGRAVAIAFAREGADVVISYLDEHDDARETARWVEEAGRTAVLAAGDLADTGACEALIGTAVGEFGRIDVLVNNAAYQRTYETLEDVTDEEWQRHLDTNLTAMFRLCKLALPHMGRGGSIINTSSVNSDQPKPMLIPYSVTKAGIANFSASLGGQLASRGIRVNSVAPGPIWTPLIPATMPPDQVEGFGEETPIGRPGQPAELAPVFVMLASDEASYVIGARIAVTGGTPVL